MIQNSISPEEPLKPELAELEEEVAHPSRPITEEDSAITKAEEIERHGSLNGNHDLDGPDVPPAKRIKLAPDHGELNGIQSTAPSERQKGIAPIKAE